MSELKTEETIRYQYGPYSIKEGVVVLVTEDFDDCKEDTILRVKFTWQDESHDRRWTAFCETVDYNQVRVPFAVLSLLPVDALTHFRAVQAARIYFSHNIPIAKREVLPLDAR